MPGGRNAPGGVPEGQGRLVGRRYRLLSPIGRGGMGMVWHAHDVLLDRDVAVKELILPFGLDHAGRQLAHRRVLREARSAARLSHPGIVTVHDVVEEDGRPWIVMELIRAWSLEQAVRQHGPLPVVQTAEIGIRVLAALRHAHAAGILHRDVKPGNVLLTQDRVVLTDFGIAAIEGDVSITQTGLLMGSPAYIPPERLQGRPITQAADLWSFGATLYAAVEGRPPYEGPDAVAVLGSVLTHEPSRPQRAGALLPVIEGLLRKNPADRLPAAQVADMLERILRTHGSGTSASGVGFPLAAPVPTPAPVTPVELLPPLDPPSGPLPSRIIETPSGPVRVPYDPAATGPQGAPGAPTATAGTGTPAAGAVSAAPAPAADAGQQEPSGTTMERPKGPRVGRRRAPEPPPAPDKRRRPRVPPAVIAATAAVLGGAVLFAAWPGEDPGPAAPRPTAGPTGAVPSPTDDPPGSRVAAVTEVPDGFARRTVGDISAAVPEDWTTSSTDQVTTFSGPKGSGLRIQVKRTTPAMFDGGLAALTKAEAQATFAGYVRLRLERTAFRDWRASDWEYTYTALDDTAQHVHTRHVTLDAERAYEVTFVAPDAEWETHRRILVTFWTTFALENQKAE